MTSWQLRGLLPSPWPALEDADIVLVPSYGESFGNAAAEALLAERPVVASAVQGLLEVVRDLTSMVFSYHPATLSPRLGG